MNPTRPTNVVRRCCIALAAIVCLASAALAQPTATGNIQGRVLNASTGNYLNNARVTVEGTNLETFTNQYGEYRLFGVPAGTAKLDVFYTGQPQQTATVTVTSGHTTTSDVTFGSEANPSGGKIVQLDQFVVASQKDTDQKSIAINEQRFAPNIKAVVSTDQFGDVPEGNIGEFVKFLPGVAVDYVAADVRNIMLRGISPQYTAVTSDNLPMASAASSSASRVFELEQVSINNVSRTEVVFSRTPDLPAAALGGSVNLVSRSAFEYNHPVFKYRAFGAMNSYYKQLGESPGPGLGRTGKIMTGADFTYANPVNNVFGYTVSFLTSHTRNPQYRTNPQWAPNGTNSNTSKVSAANPFLEKYQVQDGPKTNTRYSFGGTADWKITPDNVLSFTAQDNYYDAPFYNRNLTFDTGAVTPVAWDRTQTQGAVGKGSAQFGTSWRHKFGVTYNAGLKLVHTGPIWRIDGEVQYSHATNHYQDSRGGYFEGVTYKLSNLTVDYRGINSIKPGGVILTDKNGNNVNPYDIRNYTLTGTEFSPADSSDLFKSAGVNARRSLDFRLPTHLQFGAEVTQELRDIRAFKNTFSFVGPNAATTYNLVDPIYSSVTPPYDFPQITWGNNVAAYDLYRTHPEYFTASPSNRTNEINGSLFLQERISAAYAMGDTRMLSNRLRAVYGIRFEQTEDEGSGPLTQTSGGTTAHIYRGAHATKRYSAGYPSVDLTYNFTDNLILRLAYEKSIGRPNLNYIIPNYSLPDPTLPDQIITVTNTSLAPEQATGYDASLEYYFRKSGVLAVSAFRKDFSNFFGSLTVPATVALLNQYGVPDAQQYVDQGAQLKTTLNAGDARVTGYGFNYQQTIGWGIGAFANATILHLQGSRLADFTNFISKTINWGLSYDNRRISAKLNWNYRGRERMGALGYDPSAYEYFKPRLYLDANLEYRISNHLGLFINGRNLTNVPQDDQRYGASTPVYAQLYRREMFGAVYTFGVKGTF
ncbi:MAG TPA: TonB-dependent receptor [Opitutaceae bacterium]|nr:TonB-dependent receptor [Opitutaceae bacterium]